MVVEFIIMIEVNVLNVKLIINIMKMNNYVVIMEHILILMMIRLINVLVLKIIVKLGF